MSVGDGATRVGLALMRTLACLPAAWLAGLGQALGMLLWALGHERRRVASINLALCFPELDRGMRARRVRAHFRAFGRAFLDHALAWWASPARLRRLVDVTGLEYLMAEPTRPTLLLVPHFVGLDMGWARLGLERRMVSVYSRQKNPVFDAALLAGRSRFGEPVLLSRQQGLRPALRAMAEGLPFYYLPDLDFGARDALFVPFFGVAAATVSALPRIARASGARVLPVQVHMLPRGRYRVRIEPPWTDFPGPDVAEDVARMNRFIETAVRACPEQYLWTHKRFKTRPAGEKPVY
ncbi:MAG: lipid A biosynthesis acyltransferase [Rhodocyclaceae bacterium]|nr:lipid A biosynthesis acyltransferase [Rhodocyclaceae bacterium]